MNHRIPPLNALKTFEAAARHLSFTKAANELFVTQAAVSHQIKSLEDFLSIKLFVRRNRTLLLTEEGQAYSFELKDIFNSLQDATDKLLVKANKGAITVATPPSFASQWLVPRISQFSVEHPDIDVRIQAVDKSEGFLTDGVDVAIYYGKGTWPGVISEKLHSEFFTPMFSPLLFSRDTPFYTLKELKNQNLLHDCSREMWKSWLKKFDVKGINANQGAVFSHSMMVLQAAALGQGVALGNTVLARPELEAGRLIAPFEEKLESKNAFYVVSDKSHHDLGKIVAFRQWLLSQVDEDEH